MASEDPHVPTPIEREQPDGSLEVERSWRANDRTATVAAADRELYDLLMDVLADAHVPDLMPAHLATACEDLVDVRETVMSYHRGSVDLPGGSYGMSYCHNVRDAIEAHRDRPPLRLVAVGCSSSKNDVDEPVPAVELYRWSYWTTKRGYGEEISTGGPRENWKIISAEHALLDPSTEIDHYETSVEDHRGVPIDADGRLPNGEAVATKLDQWALDVYTGLSRWLQEAAGGLDPRDVELDILLGEKYDVPLRTRGVFGALRAPAELTLSFPFQEHDFEGNGQQMSWMNDEVDAATAAVTDGGRDE